jgi:hypothetical protein
MVRYNNDYHPFKYYGVRLINKLKELGYTVELKTESIVYATKIVPHKTKFFELFVTETREHNFYKDIQYYEVSCK